MPFVVAATLALALSAGALTLSAPREARGATHVISIGDGAFSPASMTVTVGDTVTWTNDDDSPHTATAAGGFDSANLDPGRSFSFTFSEPGTYSYVCLYHDDMTGTITVVTASASQVAAATTAAPASQDAAPATVATPTAAAHGAGNGQPDTALPASGVRRPAWLAPMLVGLGLLAFSVAVLPLPRPARAPGTGSAGASGGWRR